MEQEVYGGNITNKKKRLPIGCVTFEQICDWFLAGLFVFPSYFGIRLGFFDLTVLRFFEILVLYMIFRNANKRKTFIGLILNCKQTIYIGIFLAVIIFTNVLRGAIGGIFYFLFNWVLVFYILLFILSTTFSLQQFGKTIIKYCWILTILSPLELILRKSPFAFLDTLGKSNYAARFGTIRISGNCTTANGYGLLLMLLLPLVCINWKEKKIDLFVNKWLVLLIAFNAVMTGSRLAIGSFFIECVLVFIFSSFENKKKYLFWGALWMVLIVTFIVIFPNFPYVQQMMRMFFSAVDAVLGTGYAAKFGANSTVLHNSTYYRELLWQHTFFGGWLNPWLGRGANYVFSMYEEGYRIESVDNYYAWLYIYYAYPGLISWGVMSLSFLTSMIKSKIKHHNILSSMVLVSFIGYYISLWFLDQLQTFPIMMAYFAIIACINKAETKSKTPAP